MSNLPDSDHRTENIIFFDGVCSLCNYFVDFLIRRDSAKTFYYAPLQGYAAKERLPLSRIKGNGLSGPSFTSVVYLKNGVMRTHSDAVIQILHDLGGAWRLVTLLRILPAFLRDKVYSVIATNRYRWFGQRETCRVPTAQERSRFLS